MLNCLGAAPELFHRISAYSNIHAGDKDLVIDPTETPEPKVIQVRCGCKHHKRELNGRVGRLHRAEKKYRKSKDHHGKGTTLRDHRS